MNEQASCVRAGKKDAVGPKEQWPRLLADTLRSGHSPREKNLLISQAQGRLVIGARKKSFVIDILYLLKKPWLHKANFFALYHE